jgi:predicted glycogen debranching enzyme
MKSEFINTNNWGGYTSSTFLFGNTRKYHGCLVVADKHLTRYVVLSQLEENVIIDGTSHYISSIQFDDETSDNVFLTNYSTTPFPIWEYELPATKIRKIQRAIKNSNKVEIFYEIDSTKDIVFEVSPLLTYRETDQISNKLGLDDIKINVKDSLIEYIYPNNESLIIQTINFEFREDKSIYKNVLYSEERKRGYEFYESLVKKGTLRFNLKSGTSIIRILVDYKNNHYPNLTVDSNYREKGFRNFKKYLKSNIDDFIVAKENTYGLIAGYPWFGEWGRDTFISFRGALLLTKKYSVAKKILLSWGNKIVDGLIPNRPERKEYNNIDGSLWFIICCYYYFLETKDYQTIYKLYSKLVQIVDSYTRGTKFGIRENADGFIESEERLNLTWMDSMVNGTPATRRFTVAVEIQMLWYNALIILSLFEQYFGENQNSIELKQRAVKFKNNFVNVFSTTNFVLDSISSYKVSHEVRPNVIIGLSLPFNILPIQQSDKVLRVVEEELLTVCGLRSLTYKSENFIGEYFGNQKERDLAYHNGTVWPWLLGLYIKSIFKVRGNTNETKMYTRKLIKNLILFLESRGLNYISEVFSANTLEPNGTLTQLWNYATLYEALEEFNNN